MLKLYSSTSVVLVIALTLSAWPGLASAARKADTITGTLVGRVIDQGGAPIAGVRILVTNQDTGNQRATVTNAEGRYQLTFLPLGVYTIVASKDGLVVIQPTNQPVKTALNKVINTAPDIVLGLKAAIQTPPPPRPSATPREEIGELTTQIDATRRGNADERLVALLPLAGIRAFDDLASLAAGVAPPPQVKGVAGPGIGAGIGSAGQFSVNGQRARSNNFTVDGSDNNDEDVGVRRQGFVSLVPQSIESIKEFQIVTHLWDAELGRNLGSQVNAVSKSGTNQVHGTFYDFFNHSALNARNFFDYTSDKAPQLPLTATAKLADGSTQVLPVMLDGQPVTLRNPSEGKDPYQRNQGGVSLGFPIRRNRTFFFGSFERQDTRARQETHFAVPTIAQRGFLGSGASGFFTTDRNGIREPVFPTFITGDSVFSLFPFPNNPSGPYGENTFTEVLPADAQGTIFSLKLDHNFKLFGPNVEHTFTGRYNFTHDRRQVPAVGGAIFSGLEPRVGAQNLSLFLNSHLTAHLANQLRGSYGRTRLRFNAQRDPRLIPSQFVPDDPFLLNAPQLVNLNAPDNPQPFAAYASSGFDVERNLGPIGQLVVTPFSPVGLDVYLFPQARTNNTYQLADTLSLFRGHHTFKFGADLRRVQLNSFLNRNFRPQVVFSGTPDLTGDFAQEIPTLQLPNLSNYGPTPGYFSGSDLAALGIPSGIFQSLAIGTPDTTVGLRSWQYNFFFNDNWRVRRGLTLDYGLRYEYNTVPREVNRKIEQTFRLDRLPAVDPTMSIAVLFQNDLVPLDSARLASGFNQTLGALRTILDGRRGIYDPDRKNFGPHVGFAWDPFAGRGTQAGKMVVRGGAGIYYDVTLGNVVSQSRNVFPTFVPITVDANTFSFANDAVFQPGVGNLIIFNPAFAPLVVLDPKRNMTPLIQPGTLNVVGAPPGAQQALFGLFFNPPPAEQVELSGGGLAFTLPDRRLRSPRVFHFNLQVEREFFRDYLLNVAYVGSRGEKLTRFRTPNGGPNSPTFVLDPLRKALNAAFDSLPPAIAMPPLSNNSPTGSRPIPGLGAFTLFDSSAASNYHSLQVSLTKRFSAGRQITAGYTWSHAIDDVSDVFDLAGAFNLPQDDRSLKAERGHANFDIRHRFVLSLLSDVPLISRFTNAGGAKGVLLGGWQFASITTYQTGQPFTVNTSFDVNLDGNLTDRLNTTAGLVVTGNRQQPLRLMTPGQNLLAPLGENGQVGRNTFRADGVAKTDVTLIKSFRITAEHSLVLRIEAFNLWNRTHFGIPVRTLEAPSFGRAVDTSLSSRQVQFALKYYF